MKTGEIIKNGTSAYFVLAAEKDKALLCRQSDGETVVAVQPIQTGNDENGIAIYSWSWGHYYGKYMDRVLSMLVGLKQSAAPETVYVKTSRERAAFLESLGDKSYESGLEAFAAAEAEFRVNEFMANNPLDIEDNQVDEFRERMGTNLYEYLLGDENGLNYEGMNDLVIEVVDELKEEALIKEMENEKWEENNGK